MDPCYDCGACTGYGLDHGRFNVAPVGGSQGTWQDLTAEVSPTASTDIK